MQFNSGHGYPLTFSPDSISTTGRSCVSPDCNTQALGIFLHLEPEDRATIVKEGDETGQYIRATLFAHQLIRGTDLGSGELPIIGMVFAFITAKC
jgi:hypothetical protein